MDKRGEGNGIVLVPLNVLEFIEDGNGLSIRPEPYTEPKLDTISGFLSTTLESGKVFGVLRVSKLGSSVIELVSECVIPL